MLGALTEEVWGWADCEINLIVSCGALSSLDVPLTECKCACGSAGPKGLQLERASTCLITCGHILAGLQRIIPWCRCCALLMLYQVRESSWALAREACTGAKDDQQDHFGALWRAEQMLGQTTSC
eukprot:404293-Pelagomonas_calceolata.AAC.1